MGCVMQGFPEKWEKPSAVSVGVFDGVHIGHKAIIARLVKASRTKNLLPTVVTFQSHPEKTLHPDEPPVFLLASVEHRTALLQKAGAENVVVLNFTEELAEVAADEFLVMLKDKLGCRSLVLGKDARMGKGGVEAGKLKPLVKKLGMAMEFVPEVMVGGERVSSTKIRQYIYETKLQQAAELLGRKFSSYGKVIPGRKRGRQLGFPTLNIDVHREVRPPFGVYAGWMIIENMGIHKAVTNIGVRPTFEGPGADLLVETHVIGEELPELYGRTVEFIYSAKVRDERQFTSPEELRKQIARDVELSAQVLANEKEPCSNDYVLSC
jgi:riboflavin kinase/FMN adenylyltransferase